MPVPPRESIGGKRMYQEDAFEVSKVVYDYIVKQEEFVKSTEFQSLDKLEKELITEELRLQNVSYQMLWDRVDKY